MFIVSLSTQTLLFPQSKFMCTQATAEYQKAYIRAYCDVQFLMKCTLAYRVMGFEAGVGSTLYEMRNAYISLVATPQ
jgi:hypothetical protein